MTLTTTILSGLSVPIAALVYVATLLDELTPFGFAVLVITGGAIDGLALGEVEGDLLGDAEGDRDADGLYDADGLVEADGETDGDNEGDLEGEPDGDDDDCGGADKYILVQVEPVSVELAPIHQVLAGLPVSSARAR